MKSVGYALLLQWAVVCLWNGVEAQQQQAAQRNTAQPQARVMEPQDTGYVLDEVSDLAILSVAALTGLFTICCFVFMCCGRTSSYLQCCYAWRRPMLKDSHHDHTIALAKKRAREQAKLKEANFKQLGDDSDSFRESPSTSSPSSSPSDIARYKLDAQGEFDASEFDDEADDGDEYSDYDDTLPRLISQCDKEEGEGDHMLLYGDDDDDGDGDDVDDDLLHDSIPRMPASYTTSELGKYMEQAQSQKGTIEQV